MQQNKRKAMLVKSLAVMVLFATASSFTGTWGGDHYRIYVNNKLVSEQVVYNQKSVPTVQLDQRAQAEQISVYYSHCGRVGTARHISFKDDHGKALKTWNFADGSIDAPMTCNAKDLVSLNKSNDKLGMYYWAKEMPEARLLANVVVGHDVSGKP